MPATVIVGAQWGDEGKGKITDLLAQEADIAIVPDVCVGSRKAVRSVVLVTQSLAKLDALGRMVAQLVCSEHRVLVHCRMGLNRSNLVIATALTYLGLSGEQALALLRGLRPGALYNETFAAHVRLLPARRIVS